tara:strand:- start:886 stop:1728 length:843 start_codon:yes stop_codon:yes gene_type:complete
MKKEVITIIPYFGGISRFSPDHTQQALNLRKKWFDYCLQSLKGVTHTFFIGCCTDDDYNLLQPYRMTGNISIIKFELDRAEHLPAHLAFEVQKMMRRSDAAPISILPYVYYTEMDQVFYAQNFESLTDVIVKDESAYIVPQRFEQVPRHKVEIRKKRFNVAEERFVEFKGDMCDDNPYVVANEPWKTTSYDDNFYINEKGNLNALDDSSYGGAYGAAYFTSKELFSRVQFTALDFQPTEQTGGHDLFRTTGSVCLKSKDFFFFHVDHLSGYEFNKKMESE